MKIYKVTGVRFRPRQRQARAVFIRPPQWCCKIQSDTALLVIFLLYGYAQKLKYTPSFIHSFIHWNDIIFRNKLKCGFGPSEDGSPRRFDKNAETDTLQDFICSGCSSLIKAPLKFFACSKEPLLKLCLQAEKLHCLQTRFLCLCSTETNYSREND